ncbi:hypothetical protein FIBSPDRAFT_768908, partial [Athelia psychrophila]
WDWKYRFMKEVFTSMIKLTLAANSPSYKTILDLDRKVHEKALPPTVNAGNADDEISTTWYLQDVYSRRPHADYVVSAQ